MIINVYNYDIKSPPKITYTLFDYLDTNLVSIPDNIPEIVYLTVMLA